MNPIEFFQNWFAFVSNTLKIPENLKESNLIDIIPQLTQELLKMIQTPTETQKFPLISEPQFKFQLNAAVLHPHFQDLSTDSLPFIEFSAMGLLRLEDCKWTMNGFDWEYEPLSAIESRLNALNQPYNDLHHDFRFIPLIIAIKKHYYLYGTTQGKWQITRLDAHIIDELQLNFTLELSLLNYDSRYHSLYKHITTIKGHEYWSTQPQQVTTIKKLINSSFYTHKILQAIIETNGNAIQMASLYLFPNNFWNNVYSALTLLTNLEIDITDNFKSELSEFYQVLQRVKHLSLNTQPPTEPVPQCFAPTLSFQTGYVVGSATRFIYDENGQWDVAVLSQFSVELPAHLDTMTTLINAANSSVTQEAENIISKAQIQALKQEATKLLSTLKNYQNIKDKNTLNPFYQVYQIINYAVVIRQIIVLLSTTITQIDQLSEAYQYELREILSILQDGLLIIVAYVDHVEIEFNLEPGSLSLPVTDILDTFYKSLADLIKNIADFSKLGEELLTLQNSRFLEQRETAIHHRHQDCQQRLSTIQLTEQALYTLLNGLQKNQRLAELTPQYAWLAPHLEHINPELNQSLLSAFDGGNYDMQSLKTVIKPMAGQLAAHLTKLYNTETLRAKQCQSVLAAIPSNSALKLLPYSALTGCDIELRKCSNPSLADLRLGIGNPSLIQHITESATAYFFHGNTDGTKWDYTPVAEAFIINQDKTYLSQLFAEMGNNDISVLPYSEESHKAIYQQMILKRAHTHFQSKLLTLDSEPALNEQTPSLSGLLFKPFDRIYAALYHASEPPIASEVLSDRSQVTPLATAEKNLKLCGIYNQAIADYQQTRNNLDLLTQKIQESITDGMIHFKTPDPLQRECQYLYHKLRPYICKINDFAFFDKKIVHAFSISEQDNTNPLTLSMAEFLNFIQLSHAYLESHNNIRGYKSKLSNHLALARDHLTRHFTERKGKPYKAKPRQGYLLKTNKLSKMIKDFNILLKKDLLPLLNESIQEQLNLEQPSEHGGIYILKGQLVTEDEPSSEDELSLEDQPVDKPYPDIDSLEKQLRHAPYVLFYKRIMNTSFHLEQLASELEKMQTNDSSTNQQKNIDIIKDKIWPQLNDLLKICNDLFEDRVLGELCHHLCDELFAAQHKLMNLLQPFVQDFNKVTPSTRAENIPGSWYAINGFTIFPAQLLAITGKSDANLGYRMRLITDTGREVGIPATQELTLVQHKNQYYIYGQIQGKGILRQVPNTLIPANVIDFNQTHQNYDHRLQSLYDHLLERNYHHSDLNELHRQAKRVTQDIEQIIQNSNNYLKLFFCDGLRIYQLNQFMQNQLSSVAKTTQNEVMSNLKPLQTILSTLMIEADTKEREWGLKTGTLANPLEAIVTQWYRGLVFPLKLSFADKEKLCTSNKILEKRIESLASFHWQAEVKLDNIRAHITKVHDFIKHLTKEQTNYDDNALIKEYQNIREKLSELSTSSIPWIKEIEPTLTPDNLKKIIEQIEKYHLRFTRMRLVYTIEDTNHCKDLLSLIAEIKGLDSNLPILSIPEALNDKYVAIIPKLKAHRCSSTRPWLKNIHEILNDNSKADIIAQTETYLAYLEGQDAKHSLDFSISRNILNALEIKRTEHSASSKAEFRESFANYYFNNSVMYLPHIASGFENTIHLQYHQMLNAYLNQQQTNLVESTLAPEHANWDADLYLDKQLKEHIKAFDRQYYKQFELFNRVQKAINKFRENLYGDELLSVESRNRKMDCLKNYETIMGETFLDISEPQAVLDRRLEKLKVQIAHDEAIMLEYSPQFKTILDWLINCVASLFVAVGLYTPEHKKRFAQLAKATDPEGKLQSSGCWSGFFKTQNMENTPIIVSPVRIGRGSARE